MLNLLCNSDIDFEEPIDNHGTTFLHRAAQCIHGRICEMVINYSSRPVDVNAKNHDGVTPLHMAALSNSETCSMLLKYDANVNSATNYGYTPLQYAAKNGCYKACRLLYRIEETNFKGRIVYRLNEKLNANLQNYYKETALHLVINTRNAVIMHSKKKWPFNRCTDRYTKIVKFLLHMGADITLQNYDGDTPLHLAAEFEMEYIVKLLLHYNADVNITNKKDETAVDSAKNNIYPHVTVLLEKNKFYSKGNSYLKTVNSIFTAQKMKFSNKDFSSKCDRIRSFLRTWSHLLEKPLIENFIFCAVFHLKFVYQCSTDKGASLRKSKSYSILKIFLILENEISK